MINADPRLTAIFFLFIRAFVLVNVGVSANFGFFLIPVHANNPFENMKIDFQKNGCNSEAAELA